MTESTCAAGHETTIRRVAGSMVLLSSILTVFVHPGWIALAIFVGMNLVQSTYTGFCPLEKMLDARDHRRTATNH